LRATAARYFLTALEVEGFRGINNESDPLRLRFSADHVNSVFAPNAQGKSSIFEALSYAVCGRIPKLDEMHAAEHASEYYTNRFHQTHTATIVLTLQPDDGGVPVTIRVSRLPNGTRQVDSPSGHPDPNGLLKSLDTGTCLVDHRTFLKFAEDTPLQRGRTFSRLLGLGKLSEFRQALETLANARTARVDFELTRLEAETRSAQERLKAGNERVVRAYVALLGVPAPTPLDFDKISREATLALSKIPLIASHFGEHDVRNANWSSVRETIKKAEGGERQAEVSTVLGEIAALDELAIQDTDAASQETIRLAAVARDKALANTRGPTLKKLYEQTLEVVESEAWARPDQCPACGSVLGLPLAPTLRASLLEYGEVAAKSREIATEWNAAGWVKRLRALAVSRYLPEAERRQVAADDAHRQGSTGDITASSVDEAIALAKRLEEARKASLQEKRTRLEKLRAELPPSLVALTEQVGHAEQIAGGIAGAIDASSLVTSLVSCTAQREKWIAFVAGAAATFGDAEVRLSTSVTQALETDYRSLYGDITNNPEIVPSLEKSPGTEELRLVLQNFYGLTDLSAPTLLAESYRNALAIAIFLSAILHDRSAPRFVVMDDVTSSFDAGHQFALMEAIRKRVARPAIAGGPQVILLSHDGLLEKYFDRISGETGWKHQRIQGMPPRGAVLTQAQGANRHRTTAEQFLRAGQLDQGEPLVRQYLEFTLQQIIRKVGIRVHVDFAMRDDRKMVQTCVDTIMADVRLHKAAGRLILSASQLQDLDTHHVPALLANWVSHYATGTTANFTPHVLLGVLDTIDKFSDCFMYDCKCGGAVHRRYYADLTSKHCSC
jgi:hypothetical protein